MWAGKYFIQARVSVLVSFFKGVLFFKEVVMPRRPWFYVEGIPQHLNQRGNNREACFYSDADYAFYLQKLREAADRFVLRFMQSC